MTTKVEDDNNGKKTVASHAAIKADVARQLQTRYLYEITELIAHKPPILDLDSNILGPDFHEALYENPGEMLKLVREAVIDVFSELHPTVLLDQKSRSFLSEIEIAIRGFHIQHSIGTEDGERYVHVEGKIAGLEIAGAIITKHKGRCLNCNTMNENELPLKKCSACGEHVGFKPYHDSESLKDSRFITISLLSNSSYGIYSSNNTAGEDAATGTYVLVHLLGSLARRRDFGYGANVSVHGHVKVVEPAQQKLPVRGMQSQIIYIEASAVDVTDDTRLSSSAVDSLKLSTADIEAMHKLRDQVLHGDDRLLIQLLAKSLAPLIVGEDIEPVKESILYQLVAGFSSSSNSTGGILRQDEYDQARKFINIVWLSEPGLGKTSTAMAALRTCGGFCANGEGIRPSGMAAGVNSDALTGKKGIEIGFAAASHNRFKVLDEFDKVKKEFKDTIHQQLATVLESGYYSINSIGAKALLPCQGPWLFCLNPAGGGEYDEDLGFVANLNLPSFIVSRMDMIWFSKRTDSDELETVKMKNSEALLIGQRATSDNNNAGFSLIDPELLAKWIKYSRSIEVKADSEIFEPFHKFYFTMKRKATIKMGMRQYQALLRVAFARARLCLRDKINHDDIKRTIELFTKMWSRMDGVNLQELEQATTKQQKLKMEKKVLAMTLVNEVVGNNSDMVFDLQGLADQLVEYGKASNREAALAYINNTFIRQGIFIESPPGSGKAKKAVFQWG